MKWNISKQDREFLIVNVRGVADVIEAEELNDLLYCVDAEIVYSGFDDNYDLTDRGLQLQKIYDRIFYEN